MRTTATNKKIRELVTALSDGTLVPRPEFQRRLVWTTEDKNRFLETVMLGYPFPEIYTADGEIDRQTARGTQILVDGQQRITTLHQYFTASPDLPVTSVRPYAALSDDEQTAFLSYDVAVRDLGGLTRDQIVEVFKRINATNYSLNEMEINHAVYAGRLKRFAERIAARPFFEDHKVFRALDLKRMGDLRFALLLTTTLLQGYFNRDDAFEDALARYNDEFPTEHEVEQRIDLALSFLDECGFSASSRIWKKADLFTAIVETDRVAQQGELPSGALTEVVERIESFFSQVDHMDAANERSAQFIYYKATVQANNDRLNRIRRGAIFRALLVGENVQEVAAEL